MRTRYSTIAGTSFSSIGALYTCSIFSASACHAAADRTGWLSTIPAEWQARQLLLTTSDPAPENMVPRSGRSTETDFSVNGDSAWTASGIAAAALNSARVNIVRDMGDLLRPR